MKCRSRESKKTKKGSVEGVSRLFDIPDRSGKLANRLDAFNPQGEKLELCADTPAEKERWVGALRAATGVESVAMDEHPSRAGGWLLRPRCISATSATCRRLC